MQEPHRKGLANHPDPESCVVSREAGCEALTGAHAGGISSCEIIALRGPTASRQAASNTGRVRKRDRSQYSAQSENQGMHGNSTRENREAPSSPEKWK